MTLTHFIVSIFIFALSIVGVLAFGKILDIASSEKMTALDIVVGFITLVAAISVPIILRMPRK